jgi:hypothetical protein
MEDLDNTDQETPIEEYPGFVGYTWDGEFRPGPELKVLGDFDWSTYWELADNYENPRRIVLSYTPKDIECTVGAYEDIAHLLDQIPSLTVMYDNGPADAGPASGTGYVFFIADETSVETLVADMSRLRAGLDADFQELLELSKGSDEAEKVKGIDDPYKSYEEALVDLGLERTRENYLYVIYNGEVPTEGWDEEAEEQLPPDLRRTTF